MTSPQGTADTTQPGREMDVKVARRVMGWRSIKMAHPTGGVSSVNPPSGLSPDRGFQSIPRYSTSIADTKRVWEKLVAEGWHWQIHILTPEGAIAEVQRADPDDYASYGSEAKTLQMAVCEVAIAVAEDYVPVSALSAIEGATEADTQLR